MNAIKKQVTIEITGDDYGVLSDVCEMRGSASWPMPLTSKGQTDGLYCTVTTT